MRVSRRKKGKIWTAPENELTRFIWYEFIVKIASFKYKNSGTKAGMGGFPLTATECFDKFMADAFLPWLHSKNQSPQQSPLSAAQFIS